MSDLETNGRPPPDISTPADPPSHPVEPWPAAWSWAVRILGLLIMSQQAFLENEDRQWLLLCAMGMMLGELGLKSILRFLLRNSGS